MRNSSRFKMNEFVLFISLLNVCWRSAIVASESTLYSFDRNGVQYSEGEKQYRLMQSNANLPQYGRCWTEAIRQIDKTCADLSERTQATLAIRFTKCFMEMSGGSNGGSQSSYNEDNGDFDGCDDAECMGNMNERVYNTFTHFYTHTTNICYYLMHQVWHSETEKTINLLQTHSQSVSKQLELAGRLQINLLQQQREGLKVQRELVAQGVNLSEVLNESQGSLSRLTEQFRNSTIEQGRQLGDLFQRLAQFHNWIVGEYTFFEQIMYYSVLFVVIIVATTAKRSENCRFMLFLLAFMNLVVESLLQRYLGADYFVEDLQIVLFDNLWLIRKVFISLMVTIYIAVSVTYVDSQQMSLNLLKSIHEQNNQIIQLIKDMKMKSVMSADNDYRIAADNNISALRQSCERDLVGTRLMTNNWDDLNRRVRTMATGGIDTIRELSVEKVIDDNMGISTRLRSRRATPIL